MLLGLAPGALVAALASAVLFGAAYNIVVAVEVIWSAQVFAARPVRRASPRCWSWARSDCSRAPPLFGAVADRTGLAAIFFAGAVLLSLTTALAPRDDFRGPRPSYRS